MFRIKICGVTNSADAQAAIAAGADALGLNFYRASKRFVSPSDAKKITEIVPTQVSKVGVFVNHSVSEIHSAAADSGLSYIQLHGDEPPELMSQLPTSIKIIRAFRCGAEGLAPLASYLERCDANGRMPDAVLIDADAVGDFGGTGRAADWNAITRDRKLIGAIPLILAGGLTPSNIASAIEAVRPDGVDVASGVESQPGRKDHALVNEFIAAARKAFNDI